DMETLSPDGRVEAFSGHAPHLIHSCAAHAALHSFPTRRSSDLDRITAPAISVPATDFTVAAWFNWTTNPSPYYSGIQGGGCCSWELRSEERGVGEECSDRGLGRDFRT